MQGLTQNTKFHRKEEKQGSVFDLGILYQSVKIAERELSFQERRLKMQRPDTLAERTGPDGGKDPAAVAWVREETAARPVWRSVLLSPDKLLSFFFYYKVQLK